MLQIGTPEAFAEADEKLQFLIETVPHKYSKQIWLLRGVVATVTGRDQEAEDNMRYAASKDPKSYTSFIEKQDDVSLIIFPISG